MKIKFTLWQKVLLAMLLGIASGIIFKDYYQYFKPIATIYTNLISMIVVPTVFFAILFGIANINDLGSLGKIGIKGSILYLTMTLVAVMIGILFATSCQPGAGIMLGKPGLSNIIAPAQQSLLELIVNMVPKNPIQAFAVGNTLQVVVFAFFLGIALLLAGSFGQPLKKLIVSTTHVIFKLVEIVIQATPYGVFAIMAWVVGQYGLSLILSLGRLVAVIMGAFLLQYFLFGLMLLFVRLNPLQFYRKTLNIQTLALATASSKATIVTAIAELQHKLGVSTAVANFILPLGAAINMTGSAIYIAACAIFFAQIANIDLTIGQYLILMLTSTIGSIGAAGYPGGGFMMLTMVLTATGLPIEGVPLILGIDRLIDMFRTTINVTGDCVVTVIVDKLNHSLALDVYSATSKPGMLRSDSR